MFDKIKKFFKKKEDDIQVTITVGEQVFENVTPDQAAEIIKQLTKELKSELKKLN